MKYGWMDETWFNYKDLTVLPKLGCACMGEMVNTQMPGAQLLAVLVLNKVLGVSSNLAQKYLHEQAPLMMRRSLGFSPGLVGVDVCTQRIIRQVAIWSYRCPDRSIGLLSFFVLLPPDRFLERSIIAWGAGRRALLWVEPWKWCPLLVHMHALVLSWGHLRPRGTWKPPFGRRGPGVDWRQDPKMPWPGRWVPRCFEGFDTFE